MLREEDCYHNLRDIIYIEANKEILEEKNSKT